MTSFTQQFLLLLSFLYFLSSKAQSQTLIVDDTTNLKIGVYRSFKEFRYNSPSIPTGFTVIKEQKKIPANVSEFSDSVYTIYHLLLSESYSASDSIWGFCDGKDVYIGLGHFYHPKENFEKLQYIGRYCLFHQWLRKGSAISLMTETNTFLEKTSININNGRVFNPDELKHTHLKTILSKDKDISDLYYNDKNKEDKTFYYLKLYSEKHKDEIKP